MPDDTKRYDGHLMSSDRHSPVGVVIVSDDDQTNQLPKYCVHSVKRTLPIPQHVQT